MTITPNLTVTAGDLTHTSALLFAYYNATAAELDRPTWESPDRLPTYFRVDHDDPESYYAHPGAYFTADLGDGPVGGVGVRFLDPGTAEVKRLYVAPEARGHGVARTLMDRLHAHAKTAGAGRVVLDCLPQRTGAIALYASLGYRPIPPYRDDHGPIELACFELAL
ncbi:GNAT family N-acetyltransferase [Streptomyces sp. SID3343]|uniref:GNAT family N-acetyltransferase n=1 Tax=Streptomyces sp. SID3343 TaxID=2690260 RepID=UPI0013704931|nr:GNAT family N-acetyltransferase [Streptomyces sp. SID3343]MYV97704.1 GNAT family N-acetyltransferase [Streptomyces sp. SID3343]